MDNPLISIIVPVYNVEKYIHPCLDSIIAQTYQDWEAILVDDGSTDKSGTICDEYAQKDARFVVVHKQNEGVAKARITAFEHSKGELITFIDSDDYVKESYLSVLSHDIKIHQADMAICQYYTCFQDGECRRKKRNVQGYFTRKNIDKMLQTQFLYDYDTRCAGIPIALWAKLVRREYVLEALKVGEGLRWSEDQTGLFYLLMHINSLFVSDSLQYYYVMHKGQVTKSYCTEFWFHQLEAYRRYKELDTSHLLNKQLHIRWWLFTIKAGIMKLMPQSIFSYNTFREELKKIDSHSSWRDLFSKWTTYVGYKNDVMFWLLKLRFYYLFYKLFYTRALERYGN